MPLSSTIHRDRALENVSVAYQMGNFIADAASPMIKVQHETDLFYVYSRDNMRIPETLRANGAESNRSDWALSTGTYRLLEHAQQQIITDRDRANADAAIKLDVDTTQFLTGIIQGRRELDLATFVGTVGNWATVASLTSTLQWDDNTSLSNPITVVDSVTAVVIRESGLVPNTLIINEPTFRGAKEHTSTVDRIKYTSAESITEGILASLFNVKEVLVGRASRITSDEGLAETTGFMWTDLALLFYKETSPSLKKVGTLHTLWSNAQGSPYVVKRWRDEPRSGDVIEVSAIFDNMAMATLAAAAINDTAN